MRALTIWQPWASLIAEGVKTIETRSWPAPESVIGDRIAIHAAKRKPRTVFESANGGGLPDWFPADISDRSSLYGRGEETADGWWFAHQWTGPLGAVVATARLSACVPIVPHRPDSTIAPYASAMDDGMVVVRLHDARVQACPARYELAAYGDFTPGRWAWLLDDVETLTEPIPAKGRQRLWTWDS